MGGPNPGAPLATEIVVTSNLHELYNGARIKITGVVGMTSTNDNKYYVGAGPSKLHLNFIQTVV